MTSPSPTPCFSYWPIMRCLGCTLSLWGQETGGCEGDKGDAWCWLLDWSPPHHFQTQRSPFSAKEKASRAEGHQAAECYKTEKHWDCEWSSVSHEQKTLQPPHPLEEAWASFRDTLLPSKPSGMTSSKHQDQFKENDAVIQIMHYWRKSVLFSQAKKAGFINLHSQM